MCITCVPNDRVFVIEQFGKFQRIAPAGLQLFAPCIGECVSGSVSLRVQQLDVACETKTKDNVFVQVRVSVQYEVRRDDVQNAYYKLTNPAQQITAFVFDVIRSTVPKIELDQVFDSKDEIAKAVKDELHETMSGYGFNIITALVVDLEPNNSVKQAMNEINAAKRIRQAANDKAEAEKIVVVKAAEADAESKYLAGVGIARQRQAIVQGLQESVSSFTGNIDDIQPKDVLQLMLMTQYFDMMKDVGTASGATTVFVPHAPSTVSDMGEQIRAAMMQASAANVGSPGPQDMSRLKAITSGVNKVTPV